MKIYNEIITQFNDTTGQWETLYEDSFEYNGHVALAQGIPPNSTAIDAGDIIADTIKTTAGYFTNGDGTIGGIGGAGGDGGGGVIICAKTIILASGSTINTSGTAGSNGVDAPTPAVVTTPGGQGGGGGAGGGGEAGSIILLYESLTNSGTITKAGGAGGTGAGSGAREGADGATGSDGQLTQVVVF